MPQSIPRLIIKTIPQMSTNLRGLHWGQLSLVPPTLSLTSPTRSSILTLPLTSLSTCSSLKNTIILQLNNDSLTQQDSLCEVRLHVQLPKGDRRSTQDLDSDEKEMNWIQMTVREINTKAGLGETEGEIIAMVKEISLVVPRGKYSLEFYEKQMRFHGETKSYYVEYRNVQRAFMLPLPMESQSAIVLQLIKPLLQGQTLYPFILIQIKKEIYVEVKTNVNREAYEKSPHILAMKQEYAGLLQVVLFELLKATIQIPFITPNPDLFQSMLGTSYLKCSIGSHTGFLYFLKKSLIFITKPIVYFRTQDMVKVEFSRLGKHNKMFDMRVHLSKHLTEFVGIDRQEFEKIVKYLESREVDWKELKEKNRKFSTTSNEEESEDDDWVVDDDDELCKGEDKVEEESDQSGSYEDES